MSVDVSRTLTRFPRERTWLLPALRAVQEEAGFVSSEALAQVGAYLRVPASEVYGVATGYPEFRLAPRRTHHVRVCTGVSCRLLGGLELLAALERRYGAPGRGEVGVEAADCFFACSAAPLLEVDGAYRGRVTLTDVDAEPWWSSPMQAGTPDGAEARDGGWPPANGARSAQEALDRLVAEAHRRQRPPLRLAVQAGTCGRAVGGDRLLAALRRAVAERGLRADVVEGACSGACYAAPAVEVHRDGWPRVLVERLDVRAIPALLDTVTREGDFRAAGLTGVAWADGPWRGVRRAAEHPFWSGQERVLLRHVGLVDPNDLGDALRHGAYRQLARALDGPPEAVIEQVKASGLQGRGGAFFPTAVKWESCRRARGEPKYLVMNGEEGEPGIFKDRHLMEGDPHLVLEGVLLAAYAAGATRAILYVHGEADLSATRLARALAQAEAAGLAGDRLLGRPVACRVEIRRGAGGFVLGEETALLESIEGRRAQPRTRPPFPADSGLWGKPTIINNVETLGAVPRLLEGGPAWFAGLGTARAAGTKVFGLSGPIARPGVVEVRNGVTLRELLLELGGGPTCGGVLQGAVVGGPSGTVVPARLFEVPMEPGQRVSPGTGGIVAVPETASLVDIVKTLLAFNAGESCGKCTPCREGAPRLLALVNELTTGRDRAAVEARMRELGETMRLASLCGLGQAAPLALLQALADFPDTFR